MTIEKLYERVESECEEFDREEAFDQMLNDCYDFSEVGGPFSHMQASDVLKEMDPVAYRCGVNDHTDDLTVEVNGTSYPKEDAERVRDELVSELEDIVDELEARMEEIDEELWALESSTDDQSEVIGDVSLLENEKMTLEEQRDQHLSAIKEIRSAF